MVIVSWRMNHLKAGLSLLQVALLIMARAGAEDCEEGEYLHEGRCCVLCPAGKASGSYG